MVRIWVKGGVWKNSEDEVLKAAVMKYGLNNWSRVASLLVRKSAKQCKSRWYEWLDPSVKKTEWTREEEEKLLHLAKLFPTQWRTIAPIVGRTAHQCLEHYEKLLDQAQGKDTSNEARRQDDPRRLRPGEIDPHPETKPSRADAIDMADDEKEMLSEAKARLANTRGKKAKRKAREKQLEEARRLASLQKRREMKAAGLLSSSSSLYNQRRRRDINLIREIPFEHQPQIGFYSVGPEETPEGNLNFANISLSQLDGSMRAAEEAKLRKDDMRKLKRLKEEDLPLYLQQLEEKQKLDNLRKRSKLDLPEPMLKEHELEAIVHMGVEGSSIDGSSTAFTPLRDSSASTPMMSSGVNTTDIYRTPRRDDSIMNEAKNAVLLMNAQTPLAGGDNPTLISTTLGKRMEGVNTLQDLRTPNSLALLTPRFAQGGQTPSILGTDAMTPFRDDATDDDGGMGARARQDLIRLQVKTSLASLPEPQNEVTLTEPTELEGEEPSIDVDLDDDMSDVFEKKKKEKVKKELEEKRRQNLTILCNLPRPYFCDKIQLFTSHDKNTDKSGSILKKKNNNNEESNIGETEFSLAEELINQEMLSLVINDAIKHPIKGTSPPKTAPHLEIINSSEMQNARNLLKEEMKKILQTINITDLSIDNDAIRKSMDDAMDSYIYLPKEKRYMSIKEISNDDYVSGLKKEFNDLRTHLLNSANRTKKLEKKYETLILGYKSKLEQLNKNVNDKYSEYQNIISDLCAFTYLKNKESEALFIRLKQQKQDLLRERSKHLWLQQRHATLQRQKYELEKLLTGSSI